ncbi:MAG: molybdate ABC transporter substrate-binding protein [Nitrospiraceae bacterium]
MRIIRMMRPLLYLCAMAAVGGLTVPSHAGQSREVLVIAGSPSLSAPLRALAEAYEAKHPNVKVRLHFDNGLDHRRTIAGMQNSMVGQYFIEKGPIHLVAPGGDELITRLEMKYYVLPGTKRAYATERLVLIAPEAVADAPESFEELGRVSEGLRLAIAEPQRTNLGRQTEEVLQEFDLKGKLRGRLDVATDSRGVLDHVLGGEADLGIIFEHEAVRERERVRIVAVAERGYEPTVHSMAMERYCPNRSLCEDFLAFIQTPEAQRIVRSAGYGVPGANHARPVVR